MTTFEEIHNEMYKADSPDFEYLKALKLEVEEMQMEAELYRKYANGYDLYLTDDNGKVIPDSSYLRVYEPNLTRLKSEGKLTPKYYANRKEWQYDHAFCKICNNERVVCGGEGRCIYNKDMI